MDAKHEALRRQILTLGAIFSSAICECDDGFKYKSQLNPTSDDLKDRERLSEGLSARLATQWGLFLVLLWELPFSLLYRWWWVRYSCGGCPSYLQLPYSCRMECLLLLGSQTHVAKTFLVCIVYSWKLQKEIHISCSIGRSCPWIESHKGLSLTMIDSHHLKSSLSEHFWC